MKKITISSLVLIIFLSCQRTEYTQSSPLLNSVLYMQRAAEYKALTLQTYSFAAAQLDKALGDKNWSAAIEQSGNFQNLPPAVILDVDETVLDNSAYEARLIKNGTTYNSESWAAWCKEARAGIVPGALDFCKSAREKGVTVFYLTNRREAQKEDTRKNLKRLDFPLEKETETILSRSNSSDKGKRRTEIAKHFRILLLIGDNAGDCFSGFTHASTAKRDSLVQTYKSFWGSKWIVLPNPAYGDWESALFDYDYKLPQSEKNKMKRSRLVE